MPLHSTKGIIRKFFGSSKSKTGDGSGNLVDSVECSSEDAFQHCEGLDSGYSGTLAVADSQVSAAAFNAACMHTVWPI